MDAKHRASLTAAVAALLAAAAWLGKGAISPTPPPAPAAPLATAPGLLAALDVKGDSFAQYPTDSAFHHAIANFIAGGTGVTGASFYGDGANANLAHIDTTVRYGGHQTLRYDQPGGIATTPTLWAYFDTTHRHVWYRAVVRYSPGWTTVGNGTTGCGTNADGTTKYCSSSAAYKLLAFAWPSYDGSGRVEITNTTEYQLYWGPQKNGASLATLVGPYGFAGSVGSEWTDSSWYTYILDLDFTKKLTVGRLWIGKAGTVPTLRTTTSYQMTDTTLFTPPVNHIAIGLNYNQVRLPNQTQHIWWGQWEVIDGTTHPDPFHLLTP